MHPRCLFGRLKNRVQVEMFFGVFLTYLPRHASLMRGRLFGKPVPKVDMFLGGFADLVSACCILDACSAVCKTRLT